MNSPYQVLHVFPFRFVKPGGKVVVYGAGVVGREYCLQVKASGYCEILYVVDRNHQRGQSCFEVPVRPPEDLAQGGFDQVVLAAGRFSHREEMCARLAEMGVAPEKIVREPGENIPKKLFFPDGSVENDELLRTQIFNRWMAVDAVERHFARLSPPRTRACPLCGHTDEAGNFKEFVSYCVHGGGDLIRRQCPNCELIFGPDKMFDLSDRALSDEYRWHYRVYHENDSTAEEQWAFSHLSPRKDGVYLNWGSGAWSNTLSILNDKGYRVLGYEPHASATGDGNVIRTLDELRQYRFDGIFNHNVLEHLRYPVPEIRMMRDLLRPDGKLVLSTSCLEYEFAHTRFHLFYFLGKSRLELADRAGLEILGYVTGGINNRALITRPKG